MVLLGVVNGSPPCCPERGFTVLYKGDRVNLVRFYAVGETTITSAARPAWPVSSQRLAE